MSMSNKINEIMHALRAPFPAEDIEWRIQSSGMKKNPKTGESEPWGLCLAYITARAIMERLDEVFGMDGWKDEYREWMGNSVICTLSVRSPEGLWIAKQDGASNTDIEATKGGISDALKRAAVKFGIGRYLYDLDVNFARFTKDGIRSSKIEGKYYKWNPPMLPQWALPGKHEGKNASTPRNPSSEQSLPEEKPLKSSGKRSSAKKEGQSEGKDSPAQKNDGNLSEMIADLSALQLEIDQTPEEEEKMLTFYKVGAIKEMDEKQLNHAIGALKKKKQKLSK